MISSFSNEPIPVNLSPDAATLMQTDITRRIRLFLGHYDLRIFIGDRAFIDVGRGSFNAALRIKHVNIAYSGCIGTVGQFCDFALPCELFGGGEHRNDEPVNITMTGVPLFSENIRRNGHELLCPREHTPIEIGNVVLISAGAKVISGTKIHDGVVLGADALATGILDPFSIYGGLPARKIKDRFPDTVKAAISQVRWWDFDLAYLGNHLNDIQKFAIATDLTHIYRKPTPRIIIKMSQIDTARPIAEITGFLDRDKSCKLTDAPTKVRQYLHQLSGAGPYYWLANAWE